MTTHIAIVLDRSGSMESCREAAIQAINGYLKEAKADASLKEADLALMIFDTESINTIRSGPIAEITEITAADFVPRGGTPLFDAVGRGIDHLDGKAGKGGKAVLVVMTDGFENASRKHTAGTIKELIDARKAAGWLVTFLGAGIDAAKQGLAMGVNAGMTASFAANAKGLRATMSSVARNAGVYASTQSFEEQEAVAANAAYTSAERAQMADGGKVDLGQPGGGGSGSGRVAVIAGTAMAGVLAANTRKPAGDAWGKSGDVWGG